MEGVKLLVAAGRALYGERWHTPIARDLGTTYRTVRNWMDGRYATPIDLTERLATLLRGRNIEIESVLKRIGTEGKESK